MYVSNLALNDYRSYRGLVLEIPKGVVVISGANGRGKTNLVESIAYLSTFASHRVSTSNSLVRVASAPEDPPGGAVVRLRVQEGARSTLLELEISRGRANRGRLNKSNVAPRELLGNLRTVTFAPEDLDLLRGDPGARRRFLDEVVTKIRPHYLATRQDFERVLRQRAATLKQLGPRQQSPEAEALLEVWDRQLADLSARMVVHRRAVVRALQPLVAEAYRQVTSDDRRARIEYRPHLRDGVEAENGESQPVGAGSAESSQDSESERGTSAELEGGLQVVGGRIIGSAEEEIAQLADSYVAALGRLRSQELRRGINLEGAHRDDLQITLDGLPVKGFASHGELWSSALMLRLAELQVLRLDGDYPVLILDDVFAELDSTRRAGLIGQMAEVDQVFVTVADGTDLPADLRAHHFRVSRGEDGTSEVEDLGLGGEKPPAVSDGTDAGDASGASGGETP